MKNILIVLIIGFFLSGIMVFGQSTKTKQKPKTISKEVALQNEINSNKKEINKLNKELEALKSQIKERDKTIENLRNGKKDLNKNLTAVKDSTNTIKEKYEKLQSDYDSIFKIKNDLETKNNELITQNKNYMYATIGLAILSALFLVLWLLSRKKNNKANDGLLGIFKEQFKDIDSLNEYFSDKTNHKFEKNDIIDFLGKIRQVINENDISAKQTNNWQKITDFARMNIKDLKSENEIMPLLEKALLDLSSKHTKNTEQELAKTNDILSISKSISNPESSGLKFYFNNPTKSGFFNDEQRTINRTSETLFEFILNNTNHNEASYFISASPDAIPSALNFHDYRIEPVCDCENVYETNHKNIISKGVGKARLEDGKWIIKQAAKVRYV